MTRIALIGAGGKMGFRLSRNLKGSEFKVDHVEVSEAGRQRLSEELGIECTDAERAVPNADVVVLAVPDTLVGKISHQLSPLMESGTMVVT
ncbi:MAG: NAD(P)-binding domain-containing protein, partial [Halomonas sp.]|nr:NAD(P)-binding domain-containing protein [Halomonas sp.]